MTTSARISALKFNVEEAAKNNSRRSKITKTTQICDGGRRHLLLLSTVAATSLVSDSKTDLLNSIYVLFI